MNDCVDEQQAAPSRPTLLGSLLPRVALAGWFGVMLAVGATLLAKHLVALPAPARSAHLAGGLVALRPVDARSPWLAVHVLYAGCRCSQRIVDHLLGDTRPAGWSEVVAWVGAAPPPAELARRFTVRILTRAQLATFGIEAAPLLVAIDPAGQVRYAGGYTTRKQGPVIEDGAILDELRSSPAPRTPEALPVFGCAVSDRLKDHLSWWRTAADRAER